MEINEVTERILAAAFKVHRNLGPGLLESCYQACLEYELLSMGLRVEREYPIPLAYEDVRLDCGYRIDLFVEREVVVVVKSVIRLEPVHSAQVLTYLRLSGAEVGLLFNFNVKLLMDGFRRLVHGYKGPLPRAPRTPR